MAGTKLEEKVKSVVVVKPQLKQPRLFKVVMLNDDYTPMDFVIELLKGFFHMGNEAATQTMLEVHTRGKAVCGIYTKDVAETKVVQINELARISEYPLLCEMEAD